MVGRASVAARDKGGGYEAVPVIFVLARFGRSVCVVVRGRWLSLVGGTEPLFRENCPYERRRGFRGQYQNGV